MSVVSWTHYHAQHENIIWCGPGSLPGARAYWYGSKDEKSIWRIPIDPNKERLHPTQKPVALYERALHNSSKAGNLVVDCFLGSGTALIAAEKLQRRCYGMELDPHNVDLALQRWEKYTGQKPSRVELKAPLPR
jgi:DNA modification methylase